MGQWTTSYTSGAMVFLIGVYFEIYRNGDGKETWKKKVGNKFLMRILRTHEEFSST